MAVCKHIKQKIDLCTDPKEIRNKCLMIFKFVHVGLQKKRKGRMKRQGRKKREKQSWDRMMKDKGKQGQNSER